MRKNFWLLGRNLHNRICGTPLPFVVAVLGLCACAITCIVMLQIVLENYFELNDAGELVRARGTGNIAYAFIVAVFFVLALANLIMLFRYLIQSRRKTYLLYKMYGCGRGELFFLAFGEKAFYTLLGGVMAVAVYAPLYIWQERMRRTMFPQSYWGGIILYAAVVLVISAISSLSVMGVRLNHREG